MEENRLNLGCGQDARPNFLNIDIRPFTGCTQADILTFPYQLGHYRQILLLDVLEYIPHKELPWLLRNVSDALAPGGLLKISSCNTFEVIKLLGSDKLPADLPVQQISTLLYGNQSHPFDLKRTAITPKLIAELVGRQLDFLDQETDGYCFRMRWVRKG